MRFNKYILFLFLIFTTSQAVHINGQYKPIGSGDGSLLYWDYIDSKWVSSDEDLLGWDDINDLLTAKSISTDFVDYNLAPIGLTHQEGRIHWDPNAGTLSVGMPGGNVEGALFQEMYLPRWVKNTSGSDMVNGDLVFISGGSGVNAYVSLADCNSLATAECTLAMLTEDIGNNKYGYATTFGIVEGDAVQPIDASAGTCGDKLYLSNNGKFTVTEPVSPNYSITIGQIFRPHATEGWIFVNIHPDIWKTVLTQEYVPYTGANADVDLGVYGLEVNDVNIADTLNVVGTATGITPTSDKHFVTKDYADIAVQAFNGSFLETINFTISEAGGTVTGTLEQSGGGDLIQTFSDGQTTLDCTPAKTVDLTAYVGTDAAPAAVFVYVLQSDKTNIAASNSDWPSTEHIKIADLGLQSAATTGIDDALVNRNWNDHTKGVNGQGHITHIEERLRQENASWRTGVDVSIKDAAGNPLPTSSSSTAIELVITEGKVYQLHKQTSPAVDMYLTATDTAHIVNQPHDEGGGYDISSDLVTDITRYVDGSASGVAIGTNKYFNLVLWGVQNKTGEASHLMINLPTGNYTSSGSALSDSAGTSVYDIPQLFRGKGYLIARLTFRLIAGSQWTYVGITDLRGKVPGNTAGTTITTTDHSLLSNLDYASSLHTGFLANDGSTPLTGDWDVGPYYLQALQIRSDVATGTTPLIVASTTEVANLHSATTTALNTARNIGGVSFDGTADIIPTTIAVTVTADATASVALWDSPTGNLLPKTDAELTYNAGTGTFESKVITEQGNAIYNATETPGGELGGTFASFTVDATHSGSAHHAESHTIASHNDTTATGTELETLTDGSNADALHIHSGGIVTHASTTGQTATDHQALVTITDTTTVNLTLVGQDIQADGLYTAGDALTLTGADFSFDGGATPGGDLGGTWASPSVDNDSHSHTGSTISSIAVSVTADATASVALWDSPTGNLLPKTDAEITYNAGTGTFESKVITEQSNAIYNATEIPGGELGGTFASFTVDATHSGSAHHAPVTVTDTTTIDMVLSTQQVSANSLHTAGDALTLTGADFDFDGGATPGGDLGGTWALPSVDDDSHNHSMTTITDYVSGSYTITVTPTTSGTVTLNSSFNLCQYTKIGRMVFVQGYIVTSSVSSPSGDLKFSLPYPVASLSELSEYSASPITVANLDFDGNYCTIHPEGGQSYFKVIEVFDNAAFDAINGANVTGNESYVFNITYVSE